MNKPSRLVEMAHEEMGKIIAEMEQLAIQGGDIGLAADRNTVAYRLYWLAGRISQWNEALKQEAEK